MRLYVGKRSGNSHRAQLFLSVLGVAYEEVDLGYDETSLRSAEFREKNPRGQVPVLEVDGRFIWDSQAILVYLARRFGGEDWLPTDPDGMAEVMQWLAVSENEHLFGIAQARISNTFTDGNERFVFVPLDRAQRLSQRGFEIMEGRLRSNDWLALDRPTIAEMACFTYPALAHEGAIDVAPYCAVVAWMDRVRALPGFVAIPGM